MSNAQNEVKIDLLMTFGWTTLRNRILETDFRRKYHQKEEKTKNHDFLTFLPLTAFSRLELSELNESLVMSLLIMSHQMQLSVNTVLILPKVDHVTLRILEHSREHISCALNYAC